MAEAPPLSPVQKDTFGPTANGRLLKSAANRAPPVAARRIMVLQVLRVRPSGLRVRPSGLRVRPSGFVSAFRDLRVRPSGLHLSALRDCVSALRDSRVRPSGSLACVRLPVAAPALSLSLTPASRHSMVLCGACEQPIVTDDMDHHRCLRCEMPLHGPTCDCTHWQPVDGALFCNQWCLQAWNTSCVYDARDEFDDESFGPLHAKWDEWLRKNPESYFPLRPRHDAEEVTLVMAEGDPRFQRALAGVTAETVPGVNTDPPPRQPTPTQAETSSADMGDVRLLLTPGARLQECFVDDHNEDGSWFGGVVGPVEPDGRIPIGFDDGACPHPEDSQALPPPEHQCYWWGAECGHCPLTWWICAPDKDPSKGCGAEWGCGADHVCSPDQFIE